MAHDVRALIVFGETGQLRYYKEVARRISTQGMDVTFCCDRDDSGVGAAIAEAAREIGVAYETHTGDRGPGRSAWLFGAQLRLRMARVRAKRGGRRARVPKPLGPLRAFRRYHFYRLRDAERVLRTHSPDVIILGEDGIAANNGVDGRA